MNVFLRIKTARKAFIEGKMTACCYKLHSNNLEENTFNVGDCSILIKVTGGCLTCTTTFMFPVAKRYLHAKPKKGTGLRAEGQEVTLYRGTARDLGHFLIMELPFHMHLLCKSQQESGKLKC